jgi:uncharacterized protein
MFPRFIEASIREALTDTRVVAIAGPRQSGKSTLARSIAGKSATYLSLDEAVNLKAAADDPTGFVRRARGLTVIDEIQRVPELMLAIKLAVDEDPTPGRFLITGSADIRTLPTIQDSLAGRIQVFELLPLSRDEISGRRSSFIADVFEGRAPEAGALEPTELQRIVAMGGFPEAVARTSRARRLDWFEAYADALIEQDVADIANLDRRRDMPRLVELLAQHCSEMVNLTQLGAQLGMDRKTVDRHLGVLEQMFLVRRVRPWFRNELKRLAKAPKLHFFDAGLAAAMRKLNPEALGPDRVSLGPIVETFVFSELSKQATWSDERISIHHYRDHDGAEIDFILENWGRKVVAIEVKSGSTVRPEAFAPMRKLSGALGDKFALGVILYDGRNRLQYADNLWAVPIASLWA